MSKAIKFILGTIVLGLITSFIYDSVKNFPFLSSVWNILKWIWKTIFEFEVSVWQIALGTIVFLVISKIISSSKKPTKLAPRFLSYKTDKIHFYKWKWDWVINKRTFKWNISGLKPICPKCDTKMHYDYNIRLESYTAKCPRCNFTNGNMTDIADIEAIIFDNIDKDSLES